MDRPRRVSHVFRHALVLVAVSCVSPRSTSAQLRLNPTAAAKVSPELRERLRADPFTYFR